MEKSEIISFLLGDISLEFLLSFYLFALLGVVFNILLHYKRRELRSIKKQEGYSKFDWKYWIEDNSVRFFTSILSIFFIVRFYSSFQINYELNMFLGLVVGVSLDNIIIMIRNRTSINIFQSNDNKRK